MPDETDILRLICSGLRKRGTKAHIETGQTGGILGTILIECDTRSIAYLDPSNIDPQVIAYSGYKGGTDAYRGWKSTIRRKLNLADPEFFDKLEQYLQELMKRPPLAPTLE